MNKPRIIKDYDKLPIEVKEQLKLLHPNGFSHLLIDFSNHAGEIISVLPFETDDKKYMIRMSGKMARRSMIHDDDLDMDHNLLDEDGADSQLMTEDEGF